MGWSEAEVVCGKHPEEAPQPGICPSCLRERLAAIIGKYGAEISNNYYYNVVDLAASPPSDSGTAAYVYGDDYSGFSSPARRQRRRHQRVASDIMDSIYVALGGGGGLKKSRSMANYATRDGGVSQKKKGGFWNKLLLRSSVKKSKNLW